jgi:hypothetical protein
MAYTVDSAVARNTLNGIIRLNDQNLSDIEASNLIQPTAFMNALPWIGASAGSQHKWTVETGAPGSAFRDLNSGIVNAAGQEQSVTANLKLMDASFDRDMASDQILRMGIGPYMERETMKSLNATLAKSEFQLIRGTAHDAAGYDGIIDLLSLYDGMALDVEGSGGTRVYMMIMGEDDVAGVLGYDGKFDVTDPFAIKRVTDTSTGAAYNAWAVGIHGWMCLQVAGRYSLAGAYNIDGTANKSVDDDLLADIYSLFPSDRQPFVNGILMSRVGAAQLRKSRTATNPTGLPAPFSTSWSGAGREIPIFVSDALDDEESTVTTTTSTTTTTSA